MAEDLNIITGTKAEQYESLIPQIKGLLEGEPDLIANLANVVAALKEQFDWLWVGFYLVKPAAGRAFTAVEDELVLAPFQGPVACTSIKKCKGVCGTCWARAQTVIVPDVEKFPGHISCSTLSRSEIVIPVIRNAKVIAVLDIDSEDLNHFDEIDRAYLEKIVELIQFYDIKLVGKEQTKVRTSRECGWEAAVCHDKKNIQVSKDNTAHRIRRSAAALTITIYPLGAHTIPMLRNASTTT